MKLLLDMGLPRSAASLLTRDGVDTIHVGDLGLSRAGDEVILQTARDLERVIVTLDADFTAILALSRSSSPSVVRIRIEGLKGEQTAALLSSVVKRCEVALDAGAVVTVERTRIRIRHLPLISPR